MRIEVGKMQDLIEGVLGRTSESKAIALWTSLLLTSAAWLLPPANASL